MPEKPQPTTEEPTTNKEEEEELEYSPEAYEKAREEYEKLRKQFEEVRLEYEEAVDKLGEARKKDMLPAQAKIPEDWSMPAKVGASLPAGAVDVAINLSRMVGVRKLKKAVTGQELPDFLRDAIDKKEAADKKIRELGAELSEARERLVKLKLAAEEDARELNEKYDELKERAIEALLEIHEEAPAVARLAEFEAEHLEGELEAE